MFVSALSSAWLVSSFHFLLKCIYKITKDIWPEQKKHNKNLIFRFKNGKDEKRNVIYIQFDNVDNLWIK